MKGQQKKKMLKIVIIVLAVMLLFSSTALAGTLIYKHFAPAGPSSVTVPNNIITPQEEPERESQSATAETEETTESVPADDEGTVEASTAEPEETAETTLEETEETIVTAQEIATALYLYNRNPDDNTPFNAGNMFPGDAETKYFCVQVSYQDAVTVRFHADIRPGYEKLAEVLKCKIVLLTTGEPLYDGLMRDMPESLDHALRSAEGTTDELYYEIKAYLATSVGNEYQNQELIADFRWWVEEQGNLIDPPETGDNSHLALWSGLLCLSAFLLILLFIARKKEAQNEP